MSQPPTTESTWQPAHFTVDERHAILTRVRDLGQRLQDRSYVLRMSRVAVQQSKYTLWTLHGYRSYSLALGPLGLALMYDELDRALPGEGWDQAAHAYLPLPQGQLLLEGPHAFGLFSGIAGLLFVARQLSRGGARYEQLSNRLATTLFSIVGKYPVANYQPEPSIYDLTSGAVGIGTVLLTMTQQEQEASLPAMSGDQLHARSYLAMLVYHLAWLGQRDDKSISLYNNFYSAPDLQESQVCWRAMDSAYTGYGMRQGIAGLIAFLSLALINNKSFREIGVPEALQTLCMQVQQGMVRDEQGWYWPQYTGGSEYHRSGKCNSSAWCDGSSGIARALWLAGRALDDQALSSLALEIIADVAQRLHQDAKIIGPSLCHGLAGIVQICAHFAHETGEPLLVEHLRSLTDSLMEMFEEDHPFGYRAFEPDYIRVDSPWLLEGASGVALALLATVSTQPPLWDRIMLLH